MIEASHLVKTYYKGKSNEFRALDDVSFTIGEQELIAVTGKSGAGKSTLLHILGCIDSPDEGVLRMDGNDVAKAGDLALSKLRNQYIGIVLQDFALVPDYSVIENVTIPLLFTPGLTAKKRKAMAMEALEAIGIPELAKKNVTKLSGGQRQRTAIARAIVNHPKLLLADEPTGALDEATGQAIMEVFRKLHSQGQTIVIVTHESSIARQCERVLHISDGKLAAPDA